jgi:hypothetical protein
MTTNLMTQVSGIVNHAVGRVVTNADAAATQSFTPGFVPRVVRWVNLTDRITDEWYEGMAADSALETAAAGTRTLETSGGITVGTDGTFSVHSTLIVASKTFAWEAIG